jgi:hypothetical protein
MQYSARPSVSRRLFIAMFDSTKRKLGKGQIRDAGNGHVGFANVQPIASSKGHFRRVRKDHYPVADAAGEQSFPDPGQKCHARNGHERDAGVRTGEGGEANSLLPERATSPVLPALADMLRGITHDGVSNNVE